MATINTLNVDLSSSTSELERQPIDDLSLESVIGGFARAVERTKDHLEENPDLTDAFDARNLLCFDVGFLTGSRVMTAKRTYVSGLSPLKTSKAGTNGFYYSAGSGGFGPELRDCDLDSINIEGTCHEPSYLLLDYSEEGLEVSLHDASELVGKTTNDKIRLLAEEYQGAAFAVIGEGGENLVRYASVAFSTTDQLKKGSKNMRFAGRGGMGAVMGSKNLLAIVARGSKRVGKEHFEGLSNVSALNREIATGKKTEKYRLLGTFAANVETLEFLRAGIHNNFGQGHDPETEQLFKAKILDSGVEIKDKSCKACGIKCWKEMKKDGRVLGKLDYENGALLGMNLGINDLPAIMELIGMADESGLDAMSLGVCLGYEMEKQNRFGDVDFAKKMIQAIAAGEHPLKDGVFRYAGSAPTAMHVKGVELAGYLGQTNPGYAFAIAGLHTSIDTYNRAFYPGADNSVDEWVENIVRGPIFTLYDMNGLCKFSKVQFDDVCQFLREVTGREVDVDTIKNLAKKTALQVRQIDRSLGFTEDDDVLPAYCHEDIGLKGIKHFNTPAFFAELKPKVYAAYKQMEREFGLRGNP